MGQGVVMEEYKFKRVDEHCYNDLVYLSIKAFGVKTATSFYKAKMDTQHLGVIHLGFLAYASDNEPAAFYGVYPYMMEYKGKSYLAAQSGDTMTNPKHGGKGLFTTLAKMTYELAQSEGIQFIFGFPNDNSYPGFVKRLNWQHKENMRDYFLKVSTFPFAGIVKKLRILHPIYKLYLFFIFLFYKTPSRFQSSSISQNDFGRVKRDFLFFKYKSFYDNYLISISGRTAWVKVDGSLQIGDIEFDENVSVDKLVRSIKWLSFLLGTTKVFFSVSKNTSWDIVLKDKLECEEKTYIGYLDLQSGLPLENFKFTAADYDTF